MLSGNEVGLLLLDFLAEKVSEDGRDISREVACTTIVSAPMADDIARARGLELRRTLTGFKFIGEQVGVLESEGRERDFLMGFEESYGYLVGTSVRDKDAVAASMLICELSAYWKKKDWASTRPWNTSIGITVTGLARCLARHMRVPRARLTWRL